MVFRSRWCRTRGIRVIPEPRMPTETASAIYRIIARLDNPRTPLGIPWLSPVYPSPNADYGYDISDYCGIHPDFGTMEDMERLIAEAAKRDIKIILIR